MMLRLEAMMLYGMERMRLAGYGLIALGASALAGCGSLDSGSPPALRTALLDLRITEVHYHPADEGTIAGDEYEFVEIKNTGASKLDLTGVGFTDGIEFTFADGAALEAGAFLVLAANPDRFEERYGSAPFGAYTGRLNNAGEKLTLGDIPAGAAIATVVYSDEGGWPAVADGGGYSLVPLTSSPDSTASSWRSSSAMHGSPGKDDAGVVVVNEISTHSDPPFKDAIELFNPNPSPMDVSGWYLSDKRSEPKKYRIPAGTVIPANGYVVFDDEDFNADTSSTASFNLSAHGEEILLSSDSTGCLGGYCHGFGFGEIENGFTFGRHVTSAGEEHFVAQRKPTLGMPNAGPRVGPVVITEIMYHPANDTDEFLEIANTGDEPIGLFHADHPDNTWKIEGFGFAFPAGITLAKGEAVLVIPQTVTEARIRSAYAVPASVRIFQSQGTLNNSADTLALMRPEEPFVKAGALPGDTTVPYVLIDRVSYSDSNPWPGQADGEGPALERNDPAGYGNDPANWSSSKASPGTMP
jgi:hypothetical protein